MSPVPWTIKQIPWVGTWTSRTARVETPDLFETLIFTMINCTNAWDVSTLIKPACPQFKLAGFHILRQALCKEGDSCAPGHRYYQGPHTFTPILCRSLPITSPDSTADIPVCSDLNQQQCWPSTWLTHFLTTNNTQMTEVKVVGRKRTQFFDDLRNRRRCWELKEEAKIEKY